MKKSNLIIFYLCSLSLQRAQSFHFCKQYWSDAAKGYEIPGITPQPNKAGSFVFFPVKFYM